MDDIARLRADIKLADSTDIIYETDPDTVLSLLDAIEQAQKERDEARKLLDETSAAWVKSANSRNGAIVQRDQAQKDAKERDGVIADMSRRIDAWTALVQEREQQLRDSQQDDKDARVMLGEAKALCESVKMIPLPIGAHAEALLARIEAMLEKKI